MNNQNIYNLEPVNIKYLWIKVYYNSIKIKIYIIKRLEIFIN